MVKPRGKYERKGKGPVPAYAYDIDSERGIHINAWCPDREANEPPEQVHLLIYIQGFPHAPLAIRFKSPDTLGFLIEELSRYRSYVWPDSEPVEFKTQFDDNLG